MCLFSLAQVRCGRGSTWQEDMAAPLTNLDFSLDAAGAPAIGTIESEEEEQCERQNKSDRERERERELTNV